MECTGVNLVVRQYDASLSSLLDKHAPYKCIYVVERPMNDWMTDDILVPLLEANLSCYSFLSMDSIMPICTTTLYHFDRVTDLEL